MLIVDQFRWSCSPLRSLTVVRCAVWFLWASPQAPGQDLLGHGALPCAVEGVCVLKGTLVCSFPASVLALVSGGRGPHRPRKEAFGSARLGPEASEKDLLGFVLIFIRFWLILFFLLAMVYSDFSIPFESHLVVFLFQEFVI